MKRLQVSLWMNWLLLVLVVGYLAASRFGDWADAGTHELSLRRDGDNLRLTSSSDGPFLVLGIAAYGEDTRDKRWSPIDPPLVVIDSKGGTVDLKSLHWRDYQGAPASVPTDQRLYPLYVRPERFDAYPERD